MLTRNGSRRARRALHVKNFFHFYQKKSPVEQGECAFVECYS